MKSSHQKVDILERKMKCITKEFVSRNPIEQVHPLPYAIIRTEYLVDTPLFPDLNKNGSQEIT